MRLEVQHMQKFLVGVFLSLAIGSIAFAGNLATTRPVGVPKPVPTLRPATPDESAGHSAAAVAKRRFLLAVGCYAIPPGCELKKIDSNGPESALNYSLLCPEPILID